MQWSNNVARDNQRRQVMMRLVAEEAAGRAETILTTAPAVLDVVDSMTAGSVEPCPPQLRELFHRFTQFNALGVIDDKGTVVCSTLDGAVGLSVADRDWFLDLRGGERYSQSPAQVSRVTQEWVLASAKRRETPDGRFAGALSIGVPVEQLARSFDASVLPADSDIALVDASGRVFDSEHWQGYVPPEVMPRLEQGGGFFEAKSDAGEARQITLIPLESAPMFAMLSAPKPTPLAFENISAFGNFALPLLAWFLALVTAWLATDRLVLRWLDYLRRVASLYASGKLSVQPVRARQAAPVEITALADQLEDMAIKVRDRQQKMESALGARDAALKEIHHRVKNNLQIINSLLSLQSRKVSDKAAVAVLDDARGRINALSLIHRSLYEQADIRTVSVRAFLGELTTHLDQAMGAEDLGIRVECEADDDSIDADLAVPIALFATEAVTNAIKHAFPDARAGRVKVEYRVRPEETVLSISDDGIGSPAPSSSGLGQTLMAAFAKQAHGEIENEQLDGGGSAVRLRIRKEPAAGK